MMKKQTVKKKTIKSFLFKILLQISLISMLNRLNALKIMFYQFKQTLKIIKNYL